MTESTTRIRIDLAYDGADYSGWARQPGLRTVQGVLETTIAHVLHLPQPPTVVCAGRTDAGVHARGQVSHVDLPSTIRQHDQTVPTLDALRRHLPRAVPDDCVVRAVSVAPPGFDARFAALNRRYVYRLWDDPAKVDPLLRNHVVTYSHHLDLAAMDQGASQLVGLHDFAAFCRPRVGATTIRRLLDCAAARRPCGMIEVTLKADAFCHSMVRSIMGALISVGRGQRDLVWLTGHLSATGRANDIAVMPAHGLTLEEVTYPDDADLAQRVNQARARRDQTDDCECSA
ncbi:MAG: tRNA pseudouridine(38-40) synthase TruA [Propionibacteriaceae bacterium]|jgi:tRNA pseudouridine38-40 synthase|nr:tRNA pseudouridine(38-40) synthase TruA [Propionibacteriaceae bacterium]